MSEASGDLFDCNDEELRVTTGADWTPKQWQSVKFALEARRDQAAEEAKRQNMGDALVQNSEAASARATEMIQDILYLRLLDE